MDYFLKEIPIIISENNTDRLPDEDYQVWSKDEVIDFLENKLGLSKETKIKHKDVKHPLLLMPGNTQFPAFSLLYIAL